MAYSSPAMVRLAVNPDGSDGTSQPSPVSRTAADMTDAQLLDFIGEADAMIDSYLGRFYTVPVAPVLAGDVLGDGAAVGTIPHPIDHWSRNLGAYYATLSFRRSQDFSSDDPIARRYTATMQALDAVTAGRVRLQLPDNSSSASGVGAGTAINPTYAGDLFDANDFNLVPINSDWPVFPDFGFFGGGGRRW